MRYQKGDVVSVQYIFTSYSSRIRATIPDSLIADHVFGVVTDNQVVDMIFVKYTDDRIQGIRSYSKSDLDNQYYEPATGMHVQISKVADGVLAKKINQGDKEQQIQI